MRVAVELNNRWAFIDRNTPARIFKQLIDFFSFYPDGYRWSPAYKMYTRYHAQAVREGKPTTHLPGWDGRIRYMTPTGRVPAGLFRALRKEAMETCGVRFAVSYEDIAEIPLKRGLPAPPEEYAFQETCVEKMVAALPFGGGIVLAATGVGKTKTAARFFARLKCTCLFLVDQIHLLDQARRDLQEDFTEPIGSIGAGDRDIQRITVGTVQTIARHLKNAAFRKWFEAIDVIVVDELHQQMSRRNFKVIEAIHPQARFGLTATLRLQTKSIRMRAHAFAGPVVYKFPIADAMEQGVVAKGTCLQLLFPECNLEYASATRRYRTEVMGNLTKRKAVGFMTNWSIQQGRHVLQLVDLRAHFDTMCNRADYNNYRFGAASGRTRTSRTKIIAAFEASKLDLLIATRVFTKGVSINMVDTIFDMAERPSQDNVLQKFGRGVRRAGVSKHLLYVDIGSQGTGKLGKAAKKRMRALRAENIPVISVKVQDAAHALDVFKAMLGDIEARNAPQSISGTGVGVSTEKLRRVG